MGSTAITLSGIVTGLLLALVAALGVAAVIGGVDLARAGEWQAAAAGGTAQAASLRLASAGEEDLEREFRALDLDGDGKVSLSEAAGNHDVVTRFERADRNRDGRLTRAEFARLQKLKPRTRNAAAGGSAKPRTGAPRAERSAPSRAGDPKRGPPAASDGP